MARYLFRSVIAAGIALASAGVSAATVKVGIIGPFSGPYSVHGKNFKAGIDAYFAIYGKNVGPDEIEIVYRDLPVPDPAKAKALAQELIVREKADILGGVYTTPDAYAIAPILEQANTPLVIFNAATLAITEKSPFVVRTSFTLFQTSSPLARVAIERGIKKVVTAVSDYGPGIDAEDAFGRAFKASGGQITETIRMPLQTTDFAPIMQRVKNSGAEALFAFVPAGPTTVSLLKSYRDAGLDAQGIKFLAPGDLTEESSLPALGDAALGALTTFHYAVSHDSPENKAFVAAAAKAIGNPDELSFTAVGAFDGMRVIAKMIEATGGKKDAAKAVAAVKGLSWMSPRGPVTIDPQTRHVRQNIYLRIVEKIDGKYVNKEITSVPDVPEAGLFGAK